MSRESLSGAQRANRVDLPQAFTASVDARSEPKASEFNQIRRDTASFERPTVGGMRRSRHGARRSFAMTPEHPYPVDLYSQEAHGRQHSNPDGAMP